MNQICENGIWKILENCLLAGDKLVLAPGVKLFVNADASTSRIWVRASGEFWGFSRIETTMLLNLVGRDTQACVEELSRSYDVPMANLAADVQSFITTGLKNGVFVVRDGDLLRSKRPGVLVFVLQRIVWISALLPLRFRIPMLMSMAVALFRCCNLATVVEAFRVSSSVNGRRSTETEAAELSALDQAVTLGCASSFTFAECKERALVFWRLARERGADVRMVIGADFYPLSAHAWCEVSGLAFTDDQENANRYVKLESFAH